jgi:hypothetical protein
VLEEVGARLLAEAVAVHGAGSDRSYAPRLLVRRGSTG